MSHSYALQELRFDAPRLIRLEVPESIVQAVRTFAGVGAAVAAAAGFAAVMWLLVAGPGFLGGRSSTLEHGPRQMAVRQATRQASSGLVVAKASVMAGTSS